VTTNVAFRRIHEMLKKWPFSDQEIVTRKAVISFLAEFEMLISSVSATAKAIESVDCVKSWKATYESFPEDCLICNADVSKLCVHLKVVAQILWSENESCFQSEKDGDYFINRSPEAFGAEQAKGDLWMSEMKSACEKSKDERVIAAKHVAIAEAVVGDARQPRSFKRAARRSYKMGAPPRFRRVA